MNMNNLIIEKNGYKLNNPNNIECFVTLAKRNRILKQYLIYQCDLYNSNYTIRNTYKISRFKDDMYAIEGCVITIPAGDGMNHFLEILTQPIQDVIKENFYNGAVHYLQYKDKLEIIVG